MSGDEVQKTWERSHEIGSRNYHLRGSLLRKLIPDGHGKRALDAGCSTGGATRILLERGYEVDGVDQSSYAVSQIVRLLAPEYRPRFRGIVEDLSRFRPEKKYDLLVLSEVLEHLENDLDLLRKAMDWLVPGGRAVITVPADPALWSDADRFSNHYRRYTSERLREVLEQAGLSPDVFWSYGFPFLWTYTRLRNRWVKIGTMDRMVRTSKGTAHRGIRVAAVLLKSLVNLDRFFVGLGKPVGLMVLATRR
jgi:SAM-dependent methyltransferase